MEGDGTDPMFAHTDVEKNEEQQNTMASLHEVEAEAKKAIKDKEEAAHLAAISTKTEVVTANITAYMQMFAGDKSTPKIDTTLREPQVWSSFLSQ